METGNGKNRLQLDEYYTNVIRVYEKSIMRIDYTSFVCIYNHVCACLSQYSPFRNNPADCGIGMAKYQVDGFFR